MKFFTSLKVFHTLRSPLRITSVDIFRSVAIIAVVLFHFNNTLPNGYLGVDLFFVISGLLVGGLLTREFRGQRRIRFLRFFLQRGFKIWPSYYFFLLFGSSIAWIFYHHSNPDQLITLADCKRYLFFYQNYTGKPFHWSFDHVWSLCIEEHFYIMLPILFIFIQRCTPSRYQTKILFVSVILVILSGISFKFISYYFTNSQDTYSGTHNRIDALAWGVFLNLILSYYPNLGLSFQKRLLAFICGLTLFIVSLWILVNAETPIFKKLYFHSIVPAAFALMIWGLYKTDFSRFTFFRFIAYYSYNWYLWHVPFILFFQQYFGTTIFSLICYLLTTFSIALIATIIIEEPVLKIRHKVISRIFVK